MSNQNLHTLNVETLNFTGPTIYHRGRPWYPRLANSLCTDYLGVGPNVICPGDPGSDYNDLSLQVINNAQISTTLSITPGQPSPLNTSGLRLSAPYDGIGPVSYESEIQFANNFTILDGFGLLFDGSNNFHIKKYVTGVSGNIFTLKKDTGFIGLNLTDPVTLLDINGNTTMRGYLDMSCNHIIDISGLFFCSGGGGLDLSCNPIIDVSGIYFCDGSSFTHGNSLDISGDGIVFMTDNGTERMIIDASGRVGIGTTTPVTPLDISGNTTMRGYLDMSCNRIIDVSGIYFCKDGSGIDLSCNPIRDVSGIYFCDGSSFTHGHSLDISANTVHIVNANLIVDASSVSIGTTDTSGSLYIVKSDISDNYGPETYPPNLYLRAGRLPTIPKINAPAVLKFSAQYSVTNGDCEPAYIWHGYRVGTTAAGDSTDGRLCMTANGFTSFILDGKNGHVGIGHKGQIPQDTLIPTQPLDVSGNTQIRGDLLVGGIQLVDRQLKLRCAAGYDYNPNKAKKGLIIWDGPLDNEQGGLFTALATDKNRSLFEFGLSYNQEPSGGMGPIIDVSNIIVLDSSGGGRVGIGTFAPLHTLDVSGNTRLRGALFDITNGSGGAGQVLTSTGSGTEWADAAGGGGSGFWVSDTSGTIYYDISGDLTKVGIGTSSPMAMLDVSGDALIHGLTVGMGNSGVSSNTAVGYQALQDNTTGQYSVAIGYQALRDNSGGNFNVATGSQALYSNTLGSGNVATGYSALYSNIRGSNNVAIGPSALYSNLGGIFGYSGSSNVAVGYQALYDNSGGNFNVAIGYEAGKGQTDISNTINVGNDASCNASNTACIGNTDISCVYLGSINGNAKLDCSGIVSSGAVQFQTQIQDSTTSSGTVGQVLTSQGSGAWIWAAAGGGGGSWTLVGNDIYNNNSGNVGIGTTSPATALDVSGVLTVGVGRIDMSGQNTAVGYQALNNPTGDYNTAVGYAALILNIGGAENVATGNKALFSNHNGSYNVATGSQALYSNGDGEKNVATGWKALYSNDGGLCNTATGYKALEANLSGFNNVAIGCETLNDNTIGINNTAVGYQAGKDQGDRYNTINIGFNTSCDASNTACIGDVDISCVYFGSTSGNARLDCSGIVSSADATINTLTVGLGGGGVASNTALGYDALTANTDASCNTAVGFKALYSNTTGSGNTATGYRALHNTDTIFAWNTATGSDALFSNTIGTNNVAIGYKTLYTNVDGHNNIAIGTEALHDNSGTNASPNSGGSDSIAIGYRALFKNDVGKENIAIGSQTLSKLFHASHGVSYNTAIGNQAMMNNTNGQNNTAVGEHAMGFTNDSGDENTAIGGYTLYNNGGLRNTAIGYKALYDNSGGNNNVAVGWQTLYDCADGSCNVAIGYQALHNSSGTYNTAIGHDAGQMLFSGNDNIFIGKNAQPGGTVPSSTDNQIVIGSNNTGLGDNTVALGNTYVTYIKGQVGFTTYSDSRIKKNITDSDLGLDFINKLRPIKYNKVNPADYPEPLLEKRYKGDNPDSRKEDDPLICDGLIAQEVEEVLKHLGKTWSGHSANITDGKQGLQYAALTVPLVKAVQELTAKLDAMEARLTAAGL